MSEEVNPDEFAEDIKQALGNIDTLNVELKKPEVKSKGIDADNLCLHLTYLSTQKLRKHSENLNHWTKRLVIATLFLFGAAIAQIVVLIVVSIDC